MRFDRRDQELRGACPERSTEILRCAQNDKQRESRSVTQRTLRYKTRVRLVTLRRFIQQQNL